MSAEGNKYVLGAGLTSLSLLILCIIALSVITGYFKIVSIVVLSVLGIVSGVFAMCALFSYFGIQ